MKQERVQKLIAQAGIASRRKAEELIAAGKVKVNGIVISLGDKATFKDQVLVNGKPIFKEEKIYLIMNKPENTITTLQDPQGRQTIIDLIKEKDYVFPVGRLDFNTTGTLLLTNDGEMTNKLTHPSNEIVRVYRARLERTLTDDEVKFLNSDKVMLDDEVSKQTVTKVETKTYVVAMTQGKYHHVKRLFELIGSRVQGLTRIEFAGLTHIGLQKGAYRKLKPKELKWLKTLTKTP